jgi:hypothetical protein
MTVRAADIETEQRLLASRTAGQSDGRVIIRQVDGQTDVIFFVDSGSFCCGSRERRHDARQGNRQTHRLLDR